jgi:hypothetical protein
MLLIGPSRIAPRRRRGAAAFLSLATPVSPQPPGAPLVVSGTYGGAPTGIRVAWRQGGSEVGPAVMAGVVAGGAWSATITTPATTGVYTLHAAFEGGGPEAQSGPVTISASGADVVANFTFEGSGLTAANAVALFGHGFAQGDIPAGASAVLRNAGDGTTLYRTQMNVLSSWGDGSVKTALLAGELPALADGATLAVDFVRGVSHPDPGPVLSFASALSGRSATIKTWAPGNTTTPLWTFDPLAAIGSDRWHEGPLALSTRVETAVPSSAVLNTSGTAGVIESVRLAVDVIVTKDGFLELDVCFSNDRLPFLETTNDPIPTCGIARFGYTIEIDGQVVYDQRPATGAGRDLLQWSQWIRRRGRKADGTALTTHGASNRAFFRPDFDLLVRSGLQLNFDRSKPLASDVEPVNDTTLSDGTGREADPYWPWGLARFAGMTGGRQEIGYRTIAAGTWLRNGSRNGQILTHRQFEAASVRPMYYRDWNFGTWATADRWPRLSLWSGDSSPAGTLRTSANGLPSDQRPTHNDTDHITIDHAHHGSFNWTPALLAGRRVCYDALAARVAWIGIDAQDRANGNVPGTPYAGQWGWRGLTPDHTTGTAWSQMPWRPQVRSVAWDFRDLVDCAAILPDGYPYRQYYDRSVEAWIASYYEILPETQARHGTGIGLPLYHGSGSHTAAFMYSFVFYGLATALRLGLGGPRLATVAEELAKFRVGCCLSPDFSLQHALSGRDIYLKADPNTSNPADYAQNWAEALARTAAKIAITPADWSNNQGERDWQRNVQSGLALLAEYGPTAEIRAQAMDALVLLRSERWPTNTGITHPATNGDGFFGAFFTMNSVIPERMNWPQDSAPVIPAGQSFSVAATAPVGTLVGTVRFTGAVPRNSAPGRGVEDAWVIVSQPTGNPFRITQGGSLRVNGTLPVPGSYTVQVYCRTFLQNRITDAAVEHRSATVAVTVNVV